MEYKVKATTTTTIITPSSSSSSIPVHVPTMISNSPPPSSSPSLTFPSSSQSSPNSSATATVAAPNPTPPPQPQSPPPPPPVVVSPCAACKILRRRCVEKCVLAPYFPPTDPLKFTIAHRVFGASNIIKFLQELPDSQRADAVSSMVYEANARIRDPVYGCAGAICQLQKQVSELQGQLAKAQAELVNMQCQQANLVALICMEMSSHQSPSSSSSSEEHQHMMFDHQPQPYVDMSCFIDDKTLASAWEPLWT